MTLTLPVNAEKLLIDHLLADGDVTAIFSTRVYTVLPNAPTYPALRVNRIGGFAVTNIPLHLEAIVLQLDAWGGTQTQALNGIQTVRASIAATIVGAHDLGVVTKAEFGNVTWLPDATYDPARPRYTADVTLYVYPA